jgi:thiopurine S-methyltransferase
MWEHPQPEPLNEQYWNERYRNGYTGWDIGQASRPLKEYIDQLTDKHIRILIPGCGNGYEAEYLHERGFKNVTVADISLEAVTLLRKRLPEEIQIVHQDFFKLHQTFDLILEQTFFCAIHPSLRKAYVEKMYELLAPGGTLAGVWFNRTFEGGPPFGGNLEEYLNLFSVTFNIQVATECYNSIPPRAGTEVFMILKKPL